LDIPATLHLWQHQVVKVVFRRDFLNVDLVFKLYDRQLLNPLSRDFYGSMGVNHSSLHNLNGEAGARDLVDHALHLSLVPNDDEVAFAHDRRQVVVVNLDLLVGGVDIKSVGPKLDLLALFVELTFILQKSADSN